MEGAGGGGQRGGGMHGAHAADGQAMQPPHGGGVYGIGRMQAAGADPTTYASTASALKPRAMRFGTPGQRHAGAAAGRLRMPPPKQQQQQQQQQRVLSSAPRSSSRPSLPGMPTGVHKKRSSSTPRLSGAALLPLSQHRTSIVARGLGDSVRSSKLAYSEFQALIEDSKKRLGPATLAGTPGVSSPIVFVDLSAIEDEEKARQAGKRVAAAGAHCEQLTASIQQKILIMGMASTSSSAAGVVPSSAQRALMDRQGGALQEAHTQASRLYEPIHKLEAQRAAERSSAKVAERAEALARRKADADALAAALKAAELSGREQQRASRAPKVAVEEEVIELEDSEEGVSVSGEGEEGEEESEQGEEGESEEEEAAGGAWAVSATERSSWDTVFASGLNPSELLINYANYEIPRGKLRCMATGSWLNDEAINLYMVLLQERDTAMRTAPPPGPRAPTSHFFNSFFLSKLYKDSKRYDYNAVRRWTAPGKLKSSGQLSPNILSVDRVIVPVNDNNIHWTCAVIDIKGRQLMYLDSMGGQDPDLLEFLARYIADESRDKLKVELDTSSWVRVHRSDVPRQRNGCDCGMFTILYADRLGLGRAFDFTQNDVTTNARVKVLHRLLTHLLPHPVNLSLPKPSKNTLPIADAGHSSDALAVVLAVVQAQTQQIASLVDLVHLLVSRVPGAPMQMPHAVPHAAHSAPRAAPAAKAAQPARPAAAAAPVASAAGALAAERPAAAGAARAASARGPSRRGGLPARVGETSLCRSHVLSIPVAAATRLIAGHGSEGQMARDGIVRGALRDASYLGSTRHVRRLFSDCYGSEETAVAAAAVRVAAAAVDGVSLPVCLAMNLVRFVHDVSGRDRPAGGGVVSASFLNAKPDVGGIGVEPRRGGVLRVLFIVASDAVADTVVRSRRNLRDVDPSAAVFDVVSDREEAQHRALWPAFLAAKAAGKRAQFHRARLVVDGERVPAPAC
ncbi:hypothetical protein FOA52_003849 [Chlamydomonas sp. UWO 241]|nr:hypothetical protein FOA52_003849 [Chlamydomonas sp. UWO 241]